MRYLYRRGKGASRRVMHLTPYDPYTGEPTMYPICGRTNGIQLDTTINVPLGRPLCKRCGTEAQR